MTVLTLPSKGWRKLLPTVGNPTYPSNTEFKNNVAKDFIAMGYPDASRHSTLSRTTFFNYVCITLVELIAAE